ncbi:MAG TPA: cyclic nucleotide-binding domain-containing protein [Opitutaceae bacterium]|nr:cyclic nucleotide-binding domain-containing protein [Opitutaceae bacterium]
MSAIQSSSPPGLPLLEPSASPVRTAALLVPLLALTIPVFWIQAHTAESPVTAGTWVVVVLSALANIIVIAYHYVIPAHPKFLMVPWRRLVLTVHILSGTVELAAGLIACFSHLPAAAVVMAVAALFFHVPSAFFQLRIVFGSRAIMVPSYLLCIITHAFCAGMLLAHPASQMWAVNTFLVFNVYVWCRIYYYLFDMLKLFSSMKYSISILAAGATMIPALFGPLGFMLLVSFIGAYILLYRWLFVRSAAEYNDFVREKARDSAARPELTLLWNNPRAAREAEADARACFEQLDHDRDGRLSRNELREALVPWGLPAGAIDAYADRLLTAGMVDFACFQREVWSIGAVRNHALGALSVARAVSDRDKAELVFRHLDLDGDGCLSPADLDLLLLEWGLPQSETRRYLARVKTDENGRIIFGEFLRSMEPVWRYIYYEIFRAEYTRRGTEMIGRGVSAIRDARKTGLLREKVKRELLARVPFLAGAGEELISDLAASLVQERYAAGETVFPEGSEGNKFYLVASGLVRVSKRGEALSDLGPGGCIGEGSLLTDHPRSATVTACQDSTLFSLTRASFSYLTEAYPDIRAELRRLHEDRRIGTTTRTLERQLALHLPFLRDTADPGLIADLAGELRPVFCRAGEILLKEGEAGDRFYIIEHGSLQVSRRGETLATLTTGGCLGEGALLDTATRSATATAVEDTGLLTLDRQSFHRILSCYPRVQTTLNELHRARSAAPYGDSAASMPAVS